MLAHGISSALRLSASTVTLDVKVDKKLKGKHYGRHGAASRLALAFAPFEGIQPLNPQADMHQLGRGVHSTYFM